MRYCKFFFFAVLRFQLRARDSIIQFVGRSGPALFIHLLFTLSVNTFFPPLGYKAWHDTRLNALPDLEPTRDMGEEKAVPSPDMMHRARDWIPFDQRDEADHQRLRELAYK